MTPGVGGGETIGDLSFKWGYIARISKKSSSQEQGHGKSLMIGKHSQVV